MPTSVNIRMGLSIMRLSHVVCLRETLADGVGMVGMAFRLFSDDCCFTVYSVQLTLIFSKIIWSDIFSTAKSTDGFIVFTISSREFHIFPLVHTRMTLSLMYLSRAFDVSSDVLIEFILKCIYLWFPGDDAHIAKSSSSFFSTVIYRGTCIHF